MLIATLALAGCSQAKKDTSSPPASVASTPPSSSATPTPTPTPSVTGPASLGGRCADLLPVTGVDEALGRPVIGKTTDILGVAEPNIGRLTYLNCRYGLAAAVKGKPAPTPPVEIGISLYKSVDQAARRVLGTVDDYRSHGGTEKDAAVGTNLGSILLGYGSPTIVVAAGPRTVAITVDAKLIAGAPNSALVALATFVLNATAGYTGAPGAGSSSAPASGSTSPGDSASPSTSTTS
ncbi:MAG: hypothetical protein M3Y89_16795 [Actinomycetota bacterium]|nr:hypothetical protein [Actinomycetota bacterium]